MTADFSLETTQAGRCWNNTSQSERKKEKTANLEAFKANAHILHCGVYNLSGSKIVTTAAQKPGREKLKHTV